MLECVLLLLFGDTICPLLALSSENVPPREFGYNFFNHSYVSSFVVLSLKPVSKPSLKWADLKYLT